MNRNDLIKENRKLKARIAELERRPPGVRASVVRLPRVVVEDADDVADEVLG